MNEIQSKPAVKQVLRHKSVVDGVRTYAYYPADTDVQLDAAARAVLTQMILSGEISAPAPISSGDTALSIQNHIREARNYANALCVMNGTPVCESFSVGPTTFSPWEVLYMTPQFSPSIILVAPQNDEIQFSQTHLSWREMIS